MLLSVAWTGWMWHTAWLFEDAFISFRVVHQALAGHGLRWNLDERVMVYSHPLWVLLQVALGMVGLAPVHAALVLTLAAAVAWMPLSALALGLRRSPWLLAGWGLVSFTSNSLREYTSSGLENPLTLCVAVLFVGIATATGQPADARLRRATLAASALALLRPESPALTLPVLIALVAGAWPVLRTGATVRACLTGAAPWIGWLLFATAYYGTPLPNSVVAKSGPALERAELASLGLAWLRASAQDDPVGACALAGACLVGLWPGSLGGAGRAVAAGVILQCAALTAAGGDYVLGRLTMLPIAVAMALVARRVVSSPHATRGAGGVIGVVAIAAMGAAEVPDGPLQESQFVRASASDEWPGFVDAWNYQPPSDFNVAWPADERVVTYGAIGVIGYSSSPDRHFIDPYALGDAFLARLPPAMAPRTPGHTTHDVPDWYVDAVRLGSPRQIPDPALRAYAEHVWQLTRAPLWTWSRWRSVFRLNLVEPAFRTPQRRWSTRPLPGVDPICADAPAGAWGDARQAQVALDPLSVLPVTAGCGLVVRGLGPGPAIDVWLTGGAAWRWTLSVRGEVVGRGVTGATVDARQLSRTSTPLPAGVAGVDLWISPQEGTGAVGRVQTAGASNGR